MANEIKYNAGCHAGATPEERIRNRYKNSGGENRAGHTVQTGDGPNRLFTNIHDKGMKQGNLRQKDRS
jgi:hypothetical protein